MGKIGSIFLTFNTFSSSYVRKLHLSITWKFQKRVKFTHEALLGVLGIRDNGQNNFRDKG